MMVRRHAGIDGFLADAGAFLAAREAEHNLILGIASSLRLRPQGYDGPPLLVVVRNADAVMAAAIRTQPYKLILSEVDDPQAVPALLDELRDLDLPGVVGPPTAVQAFADGWVAQNWEVCSELGIRRSLPFYTRAMIELAYSCYLLEHAMPPKNPMKTDRPLKSERSASGV